MRTKIAFLFAFLGLFIRGNAQEQLNQFDSNGKKHGRWLVYLDDSWRGVKDTNKAVYCRYTFFDHGTNLNPMGPCKGKKDALQSPGGGGIPRGKTKLLNGEYKTLDKEGKVRFIFVLKNGEFVSYKEFYSNGQLCTWFDYTNRWEGIPHSYYIETYNKNGKLDHGWYFKSDANGNWPLTRSE